MDKIFQSGDKVRNFNKDSKTHGIVGVIDSQVYNHNDEIYYFVEVKNRRGFVCNVSDLEHVPPD